MIFPAYRARRMQYRSMFLIDLGSASSHWCKESKENFHVQAIVSWRAAIVPTLALVLSVKSKNAGSPIHQGVV